MPAWYREHVLPKLMNRAMDTEQTRRIRARVSADLAGEVVEIGFGSGLNLAYLPPAVTRLLAIEPSAESIDRAAERISSLTTATVEIIGTDAHRLPLPDASVDAALCTWSLCSMADPVAAIREVRLALRPGGTLHFAEHGLAPDENVRRWQARLNPLQKRFVGGCNLDRDIPAVLIHGGLTVLELERYYAEKGAKVLTAMYEGIAAAP